MSHIKSMSTKAKIFLCFILIAVSTLIIGAGQVSERLRQRQRVRAEDEQQWINLMTSMKDEIPLEHRKTWEEQVNADPYYFLSCNTLEYRTIKNKE